MIVPVAIVGASYREASTDARAKLAAVDPSQELIDGGHITGVVRLQTCSRTEWVVSAARPEWAAELLRSALWARMGEERVSLHLKAGLAGAHYLMRVAGGLDAVAEGEMAVGRQVLKAFERAHGEGKADRVLRVCWKHVESLVHTRRSANSIARSSRKPIGEGVEALVLEAIRQHGLRLKSTIPVLGQGEMGRTVARALRAAFHLAPGFGRSGIEEFLKLAKVAPAVVIATGGPAAWVTLPGRVNQPHCFDIGSPGQVLDAGGWQLQGLDALLSGPRRALSEEAHELLQTQVLEATEKLAQALTEKVPAEALMAIDEERREFLHNTLPGVLAEMPARQAEQVKKTVAAFTHALMRRTRGANS